MFLDKNIVYEREDNDYSVKQRRGTKICFLFSSVVVKRCLGRRCSTGWLFQRTSPISTYNLLQAQIKSLLVNPHRGDTGTDKQDHIMRSRRDAIRPHVELPADILCVRYDNTQNTLKSKNTILKRSTIILNNFTFFLIASIRGIACSQYQRKGTYSYKIFQVIIR